MKLKFIIVILVLIISTTSSLVLNTNSPEIFNWTIDGTVLKESELLQTIDEYDVIRKELLVFIGKNAVEKQIMLDKVQEAGAEIKTNFEHLFGFTFSVTEETASYWKKISSVFANNMFKMVESPNNLFLTNQFNENLEIDAVVENPELIDAINARNLWNDDYKGEGVKIAILDTGIDSNHSDLEVLDGNAFSFVSTDNGFSSGENIKDNHGHGTHVAGIAAGNGYSNNQYAGVAPEATLLNLKVANQYGNSYPEALMAGLNKALELGVDVISVSLGFSQDIDSPMAQLLDSIVDQGIIAVASAGNDGPGSYTVKVPGASRKAITVGATDFNKSLTSFSSRGPAVDERIEPDIVAPGVQITAPLAEGSILEYAVLTLENPPNFVQGDQSGYNYLQLSGTSMSAPLVAGAVALLKQKHGDANPLAIRAALMEGSDEFPGLKEYETGAGYINIVAADSILENHKSGSSYMNFYVHPSSNLLPWDLAVYPGDEFVVQPTVISGYETDFSFRVADQLNGSIFINLNETIVLDTNYKDFQATIKIPHGTKPGTYIGSLIVEDLGTSKEYEVMLGPLQVKLPEKKVYFDLFHSYSRDDSLLGNYYAFYQLFTERGYQIEEYNSPISSKVFSYDTVIITDPEIEFSSYEIEMIQDYLVSGGNLLVMSSFSPFSAILGLNELTNSYGINWKQSTLASKTDIGLRTSIDFLNETMTLENTSHPILSSISELTWYAGTELTVRDPSQIIVSMLDSSPVYAVYEGNSTRGKILALGQELPFYNYRLDEGQNEQFVINVIDWLSGKGVGESNTVVNIDNGTSIFPFGSTIATWIYETSSTGSPLSGAASSINISLILPNGTLINTLKPTNTTVPGVYYFSFNKTDMAGSYTILIETSSGTKFLEAVVGDEESLEIAAFNLSDKNDVTIIPPDILEDLDVLLLDKNLSDLNMQAIISNSTKLQQATVTINSIPEATYDLRNTIPNNTFYMQEMDLNFTSGALSGTWLLPADIPSGLYHATLMVMDENNDTIFKGVAFYILKEDPIIDLDASKVGSENLKAFEDPMAYYGSYTSGSIIDISLHVSDSGNYDELQCYYLIINIPTYLGYGGVYIDAGELTKSSTGIFSGDVTLPATQTVQAGNFIIKTGSDQLLSLVLIVRDMEGNVDYFTVYFIIQDSLDFSSFIDILIVFGFIALLVFVTLYYFAVIKPKRTRQLSYEEYLYQRKTKDRESPLYGDRTGPYQPYPRQQQKPLSTRQQPLMKVKPRFCGYCGTPIVDPGQKFCLSCGKSLDFNNS
ncbi:MAG: DUF4350 domain-containing protein [Candidatus Hodarchaeales archaeon]